MFALIALIAAVQALPQHDLQIREGFERRGWVVARPDSRVAETALFCAEACRLNPNCKAWTWRVAEAQRRARCELLGNVGNVSARPGATTGLSPAVSARISNAMDRPLSPRERRAARQAGGEDTPADDELEGRPDAP